MAKEVTTTDNPADTTNEKIKPSQKTQDEMAAGRQAAQDGPQAVEPIHTADPANADPARAAELADAMNRENEWRDATPPDDLVPPGEPHPGEVPSRGIPAGGLLPGEVPPQGTPDRRQPDPRIQESERGTDPAVARAEYYKEHEGEFTDRERKERTKQSQTKPAPQPQPKDRDKG